jgi:hypothetical protein
MQMLINTKHTLFFLLPASVKNVQADQGLTAVIDKKR